MTKATKINKVNFSLPFQNFMKRLQTKFDADTMSHSKVIRSTKIEKFSLDQNLSLGQNFLAAEFFSLSTFY